MSSEPRSIDELIGVYNADGGIAGELRYIAARITGRGHCALCDITHRGLTRRAEWDDACARLTTPFVLVHRNDRPEDVRRASASAVPCVLARVGDGLVMLLGPEALEQCHADVGEFERRLREAAGEGGFVLV